MTRPATIEKLREGEMVYRDDGNEALENGRGRNR